MRLNFTEVRMDGSKKNYSWWFESFEIALDVLSALTAKGRKILQAEFIEQEQRVWLPVEAFDGESFEIPFQELENQWQLILEKPAQTQYPGHIDVKRALFS